MLQFMASRAEQDQGYTCFLGAGSYDHHIPAAVWDLTARGEFMTAYTPYQAEASQGTLQLIYEYQSMMTALTGMDVSNASVYDETSGLAEAKPWPRQQKNKFAGWWRKRCIRTTPNHAQYRSQPNVSIEMLPLNGDGVLDCANLPASDEPPVAVVIQQPNFFGLLEDVDALTNWAHDQGSLVIAVVNPMTLAVLKAPGQWGDQGADIVCGDGQPFGVPMASGGPSFGFICSRATLMRQLPGRIIGRTQDLEGRVGYTLTLQAREQHIRRGKATSNICTNQGLLVTAGTIYMSLMGYQGIRETAIACHQKANQLRDLLLQCPGVEPMFAGACFHEFAIKLPIPAKQMINGMIEEGVLAGLDLADFPVAGVTDAEHGLLVAVTEKRTESELQHYAQAFARILAASE